MHGALFAFVERHEVAQQGVHRGPVALRHPPTFSEDRLNVRPVEEMYPQEAPDPLRQGEVPSRPARMPVAVMTDPTTFGYWTNDDFAGDKIVVRGIGADLPRGQQQSVGTRPNIHRPASLAYGSLFELAPQTYGFG